VLKTKDEAAKGAEAWDKTKGSVKETANESGAKLKSAVDKVKDHAQREVDTSRDMVRFTHHHMIVVTVGDKQVWHRLFQILRKVPLVTSQSIRTLQRLMRPLKKLPFHHQSVEPAHYLQHYVIWFLSTYCLHTKAPLH
jgi:hypothetical protein